MKTAHRLLTWSPSASAAATLVLWASAAFPQPEVERLARVDELHPPAESRLGVAPFLPPQRLELTFAHMASRFSEALGREVHFRTSTTFTRYAENVLSEQYDFAHVSPFLFVQLDANVYVPLGRPPGMLHAEFVTLEDSPISRPADLRGKTIALGPRDSDIDYLARYTFLDLGLDPRSDLTLQYLEGPFSCLQQLLAGAAAVCVTADVVRETFAEQMGARLKVIGASVGVPRGPLVAHRRVPPEDRETIRKLMMSWEEDPGNHLPVPGAQVPSLVAVDPADYGEVLRMWRSLRER